MQDAWKRWDIRLLQILKEVYKMKIRIAPGLNIKVKKDSIKVNALCNTIVKKKLGSKKK